MNNDEQALMEFLKDIDSLKEIEKYSNQFNLFEILGVVNTEIRHSNMLAWLLNPNEIHGLDDAFIKSLIRTYIECSESKKDQQTIFNLLLNDFEDAKVLREWNNIDLLVVSEQNQTLIVIENKIWSKESKYQLKKYQDKVEQFYSGYEKLFIFLTPHGEEASNVEVWSNISYNQIIECIDETMVNKKAMMHPQAVDFIEQYIDILRRHIVGDEALEKICGEIYAKHKRALDLIYEYKPDTLSEISKMLQTYIPEHENLILDQSSKGYIRFTTKNLERIMPKNNTEIPWTDSGRILLFEIKNNSHFTGVTLLIGPGENEVRTDMLNIALQHSKVFKVFRKKLTRKHHTIYSKNFYTHSNEGVMSHEEVLEKVKQAFDKFLKSDLNKLEEKLIEGYMNNEKATVDNV
ncbi:PD-(D/E)XK nuclease family protein [Staphylococcus simulans]|uniref:PDDEXK-like family protein n=1 Tax=Staphylococcus simulans TaxID=1286 RepID=UPI000CD17158|nr:PD-(D/E)XK nuclease family protein [Staphylococcus simulans]PNZ43337.1 hypothetical protein CD112_07535 [Staphylococcus simulans]SQE72870.1 Uncharacterised protein [Staphylococcus simulans]